MREDDVIEFLMVRIETRRLSEIFAALARRCAEDAEVLKLAEDPHWRIYLHDERRLLEACIDLLKRCENDPDPSDHGKSIG